MKVFGRGVLGWDVFAGGPSEGTEVLEEVVVVDEARLLRFGIVRGVCARRRRRLRARMVTKRTMDVKWRHRIIAQYALRVYC